MHDAQLRHPFLAVVAFAALAAAASAVAAQAQTSPRAARHAHRDVSMDRP